MLALSFFQVVHFFAAVFFFLAAYVQVGGETVCLSEPIDLINSQKFTMLFSSSRNIYTLLCCGV